jgi:hypothetical protein
MTDSLPTARSERRMFRIIQLGVGHTHAPLPATAASGSCYSAAAAL